MNSAIETCVNTLKLNDSFFVEKVATLDDAAARKRVNDGVNPPVWIAGHLLLSRKYLLELFGESREVPAAEVLKEKYDPAADYPSMKEIGESWRAISTELMKRIAASEDAVFDKAIDWNLPNGDKTVRGALLFYMYHEGWHLGQVAYARKSMGMEGLVPY